MSIDDMPKWAAQDDDERLSRWKGAVMKMGNPTQTSQTHGALFREVESIKEDVNGSKGSKKCDINESALQHLLTTEQENELSAKTQAFDEFHQQTSQAANRDYQTTQGGENQKLQDGIDQAQ
jgi:hypothetical protein